MQGKAHDAYLVIVCMTYMIVVHTVAPQGVGVMQFYGLLHTLLNANV